MELLRSLFGPALPAVSAAEAQARLSAPQPPFVLDVREAHEFKLGHIPGAKLIPLGQLGRRLKDVPQGRTILCVCASGSRSGTAARQLASQGYEVLNLRGGMTGWRMAGLPIKKG